MKRINLKSKTKKIKNYIFDYFESSKVLQAIRNGLVLVMPILIVGSFAMALRSLPVKGYQDFIQSFCMGIIYNILSLIYSATFGLLALYATFGISVSYTRKLMPKGMFNYGSAMTSIISFCVLSSFMSEGFEVAELGVNGMFTAVFSGVVCTKLYCCINRKTSKHFKLYSEGADREFSDAIQMIFPAVIVIIFMAIFNVIMTKIFSVNSFNVLFTDAINDLFNGMGRNLLTAVFFVIVSNLLWFFGIHGGDILNTVSLNLFVPAMDINEELIAGGGVATEIFSKTFIDVFVLMGGCGTTICLLIALLLFSKRRSNKQLSKAAVFPMLFNINEIMVFGLPIVLNPILFIPFIITPVVMLLTSTFAIEMGWVPVAASRVEWTTPVILGGYIATGSISGAVLQLVNIIIGVLIYCPFVRTLDKKQEENAENRMLELTNAFKKSEDEYKEMELLSNSSPMGEISRTLAEDIVYKLDKERPVLYYQPQYNNKDECIGAEALLRWKHDIYGIIYPPMIIKIATENGVLMKLEKAMFKSVLQDMPVLVDKLGDNAKISVNVTGNTIQTAEFEKFLKNLREEYPDLSRHITIEITEKDAILTNDEQIQRLTRIHTMGYNMAIDDFSMGSTSIKYLQTDIFGIIKLDGSLSRAIMNNERSSDIVDSIVKLSKGFKIKVLAEFVETREQQKRLESIGCTLYQGHLYSPAKSLEDLVKVR